MNLTAIPVATPVTAGDHLLMRAQMQAEWELAHDRVIVSRASLYALMNALAGIAGCATACGCCAMHGEIAEEALDRFEHATGIARERAYKGKE